MLCALIFLLAFGLPSANGQEAASPTVKQVQKSPAPSEKTPELPAQIELLETHVRFESNGDSRKEVHTRVHINNEAGAREFARIAFDYNRAFQQIEFPLVRITHAGGGTVDILASAISDQPNPAVVNAPAYQDVRVKSLRILGLAPTDILEYSVVTTTSHHPLAPDFWLDHTFDRSGVVLHEIFDLDLPKSRTVKIVTSSIASGVSGVTSGQGDAARATYHWNIGPDVPRAIAATSQEKSSDSEPDVTLSTIDWQMLSIHLDVLLRRGVRNSAKTRTVEEWMLVSTEPSRNNDAEIVKKALELTKEARTTRARVEKLYNFVSKKVTTIDIRLGATGFVGRPAREILASGYASQEDKFALFNALASAAQLGAEAGLTGSCNHGTLPRPTIFTHLITRSGNDKGYLAWTDPALEVAPFGVIPDSAGKCVFVLNRGFINLSSMDHEWEKLNSDPPFPSTQRVSITALIAPDGTLKSAISYSMRGQNELWLRLAFHQSPKEKWNEVAQLLALSDGFRGKITNVTASDPYATEKPFTVDYEITQPKFVDWSKKPVRIPALLPQLGLPDSVAKAAAGATAGTIDLGTPLDVETHLTLHLPPGTTALTPTGTSVVRDYATFASRYEGTVSAVTASRHLNFLERQIPADRLTDYNAFIRSVQTDEAQEFILRPPDAPQPAKPPTPRTESPTVFLPL
jgi:hypothetical protein